MSVAINGTDGITYNDGSLQASAPVGRNLIINGDMAIDQRNAGASATTTSSAYMVDRFQLYASTVTNAQTYQQVTDAPAGFNKSLKITNSSTAQAAGSAALYTPRQRIEGYNTAHLNWGTSDAKTVTVSFWVKASVTGTYPFAINNGSFNRSFVANYTISSANTWEYKTVIVAGDTSGTWNVDNTSGMVVMFSLDTNSSYETSTVDAWHTGSFRATSSNVHFLANASATWQITGLQLEAGTTATPFENLQYGQQLQLCQRYYEKIVDSILQTTLGDTYATSASPVPVINLAFKEVKRALPTMATVGTFTTSNTSGSQILRGGENTFNAYILAAGAGRTYFYPDANSGWSADSEL